jgi:hypothetical protein
LIVAYVLAKAEAGKDSEVFREAKKISRVRQAIPTPELDHVKQRRRGFAGDIGTDQSSCLRVSHLHQARPLWSLFQPVLALSNLVSKFLEFEW